MEEIWKAVTSPAWWMLTMVASLLVNLASSYCKEWADTYLGKRSEKRRQEADKRNAQRLRELDHASRTDASFQFACHMETRARLRYVGLVVLLIAGMGSLWQVANQPELHKLSRLGAQIFAIALLAFVFILFLRVSSEMMQQTRFVNDALRMKRERELDDLVALGSKGTALVTQATAPHPNPRPK
jgi:hypothetical protein